MPLICCKENDHILACLLHSVSCVWDRLWDCWSHLYLHCEVAAFPWARSLRDVRLCWVYRKCWYSLLVGCLLSFGCDKKVKVMCSFAYVFGNLDILVQVKFFASFWALSCKEFKDYSFFKIYMPYIPNCI